MVLNEGNFDLITKLVALVVQMKVCIIIFFFILFFSNSFLSYLKEFSESEGSFLELHALDESNENYKKFIHPSLLSYG